MNKHMNQKTKIIVPAILVAVALLAIFWASTESLQPWQQYLEGERWDLNEEQRREIARLTEEMMRRGASWNEIRAALDAKISEWNIRAPPPGDIEFFYTMKTVFSSVNTAILVILLVSYADIYRRTRSEFTVGLIIFASVLLLYALSSNPLVQWIFGFRAFGLGPFAMLPDLLTFVALLILLYNTLK